MKRTTLAVLLTALLCGCGGGSPEPAPAPSPLAERPKPVLLPLEMDEEVPPAVPVDPFAEVPESAIALSDAWLLFEGAMGKSGPTLARPGKEPVDGYRLWQFEAELDTYHKLTDAERRLPGLDPDLNWVSRNPLVYRSAPLVSSRAFNLFRDLPGEPYGEHVFLLPTGSGELSVRHSAKWRPEEEVPEPPPPELPPERPVEYPKDEVQPPPPSKPPESGVEVPADEPTGPRPLEEMKKWEKNTVDLIPVYDRKKEVFGFRTVWAERVEEHQDTGFRLTDLCDAEGKVDVEKYKRARSKLAAAMLSRMPADGTVTEVRIRLQGECISKTNPPKDRSVPWLVVFLQLDALRVLRESGKAPAAELFPKFEYMAR